MSQPITENISENLITIYPLLYKTISKPIRSKTSITPGGMFVLGSLKRHGTLSMSDIGKCLAMPKPHITVIVDRLIDAGYVERQNNPEDRRIINIVLTKKGQKDFEKIKESLGENLKEKLLLLDESQLEILAVASQQVREILSSILSKLH